MVSLQSTEGEQTTQIATRPNEIKDTGLVQTVGLAMRKQALAQPKKYVWQKWEGK